MLPKEPVAPKVRYSYFFTIFNLLKKFNLIIYIFFLNVQLEKIVQNNLLK